ncbi:CD209 antigen-like protein 2 [Mercenaria mercenaria]|uniref:CD209 antigen-like protein 2 n=1 Tax=Mercenaria mercenaria TaxID=6596 RepID=UPI00234E4AD8|nr:CD209 antigen-like protein 2 [Mercenaria mercenaria]XP_053376253.1 CD209 antigen-like protein 2 [Mercenaria mercenaria]XP_053376254.1 CD209 antigen-like protein 2 [Mercenaria mercenaria]
MKLILHCAVICLAFATTIFTGPETAADAKPISGCASNTEFPQGRRISSVSSNSDTDDGSSDSNSSKGSPDSNSSKGSSDSSTRNGSSDSNSRKSSSDSNSDSGAVEPCPEEGWVLFSGSCYFVSDTKLDWLSAVAACNKTGGYLAEIQSHPELDFVVTITEFCK